MPAYLAGSWFCMDHTALERSPTTVLCACCLFCQEYSLFSLGTDGTDMDCFYPEDTLSPMFPRAVILISHWHVCRHSGL